MKALVDTATGRQSSSASIDRKSAPVFVLGCPRSGTTALYHMLLSAGNFAVYRAESHVFNILAPRFGHMRSLQDREELMQHWLRSKLFRVSGLDAEAIREKVIADCRNGGDFLRTVMEAIARHQGVERWADCTPEHLLYIPEIKREIPQALIIHIIRDGRDVALSYVKQGWTYPMPWDAREHLGVAGLYWEWIVRRGRQYGMSLGEHYREVRFEDLVSQPRETLAQLSEFVGQDLDYDQIQRAGIGSVREPNSSFADELGAQFNPVARWKTKMTGEEVAGFERLCGGFLKELGYPLASAFLGQRDLRRWRMRTTYFAMFAGKQWSKTRTPLGKLVHMGPLQISR